MGFCGCSSLLCAVQSGKKPIIGLPMALGLPVVGAAQQEDGFASGGCMVETWMVHRVVFRVVLLLYKWDEFVFFN